MYMLIKIPSPANEHPHAEPVNLHSVGQQSFSKLRRVTSIINSCML
jgi:hypothetical protein